MEKWKWFCDRMTVECDWKDLGLLGLCAGSVGALKGMLVPERQKNAAALVAGATFFFSAVAIAVRSAKQLREEDAADAYEAWEDEYE